LIRRRFMKPCMRAGILYVAPKTPPAHRGVG
jgi:hypothetical protein